MLFGAIDFNTATKEELMSIKGIGAKRADAIIKYRENTPLKSVEDLKNVKGISKKLVEKIKKQIDKDNSNVNTNKEVKNKEVKNKSKKTK